MRRHIVKPSTARRLASERAAKKERRRIREVKGTFPRVDEDRRDWIRSMPCFVCFVKAFGLLAFYELVSYHETSEFQLSQCAHLGEFRGLGQKCDDSQTGPLCGDHHDRGKPESHHTLGKGFWIYHGIDREALIGVINDSWLAKVSPA